MAVQTIGIADKQTLGNPNPSTGGTDSVMNYLKKLDDKPSGGDITGKNFIFATPSISEVATSYQTFYQMNGSGFVNIHIKTTSTGATRGTMVITVDGVVIFEGLMGGIVTNVLSTSAQFINLQIPIKSNLLIRVKAQSGYGVSVDGFMQSYV